MIELIKTPRELEIELGHALRKLRLQKNMTQAQVAASAGIGTRSLYNLENGDGSTVETLLRVMKALGISDPISTLGIQPQVSPLAVLRSQREPQRASRRRKGPPP